MDNATTKILLINKLCFAERREIIVQLTDLEQLDNNPTLSKDNDIHRLIRHCKHRLDNVVKRFGEYGVEINPRRCAEIIMQQEKARWPNPIEACKFFNGSDSWKTEANAMIGSYEEAWVRFHREDMNYLLDNLTEFICSGLMGMDDRTPMSFQAILWNRYCHWGYMSTPDGFEKWYFEYYYGGKH